MVGGVGEGGSLGQVAVGIGKVQATGLETRELSWPCGCWAWLVGGMMGTVWWPLV